MTGPTFSPQSELTSREPVQDARSFTLNDFDMALNDDGPSHDASAAEHAESIRRWHGILVFVGRKKTDLAWKIGRALSFAQAQTSNGNWYAFLDEELPDISKSTIWRYIQLYERSPDRPPKMPLTDAYVYLGIVNNGRNTVEEYLHLLEQFVSKVWKLMRTARGLAAERSALLNGIDYHDFADADGAKLLAFEAGANFALQELQRVIDSNPKDNLFARHGDAIGADARLAITNLIGKGLRSPYDEHGGELIPADCIPHQLMDPEAVERWDREHRDEVDRRIRSEQRQRAYYGLSQMNKDHPGDDPTNW
jgi:hypothetical protein